MKFNRIVNTFFTTAIALFMTFVSVNVTAHTEEEKPLQIKVVAVDKYETFCSSSDVHCFSVNYYTDSRGFWAEVHFHYESGPLTTPSRCETKNC